MKKNLKTLFFSISLIFIYTASFSQTITGVVKDKNDGLVIPGVNVIENGSTNGTITDLDGNYSIKVTDENAVLKFKFIGYTDVEIKVSGQSNINVNLEQKTTDLDELVVIGYGVQKKKVATGAIASVKAEDIARQPVLRAEQAMQGMTAGVQVTNQSGQPGESPTVRIRGAGTTGNAEPLYVVDGMVVSNIDFINPADIESMDVLKDAASAAIYGSRAANGVVLITTKKGTKGQTKVTYTGYYGIQNAANTLDMLDADEYREIQNEGARNAGQTEPFDLNEIAAHNTDWQSEMFTSNAVITDHNISFSGGSEKSTYASSLSYFMQEGIIGGDKSKFERITARINSNHKMTDWLNFGNNLTYTNIQKQGIGSNESFNGVYSGALNMDPLTPLYETDPDKLADYPYSDEPVVTDEDGNIYGISEYVGAEVVNPMALLEIQTEETRSDRVLGNFFAEIEFIEGLKFKSNIGIDLNYVTVDSYKPLYFLNGAQNNTTKTSVSKKMERYSTWQWDNTLSYSKKINDHNFSALVGISSTETNFEDLSGFNAKVSTLDPDNVYLDMALDTVWTAGGGAWNHALYSQFGRVTYDYKSRYAFTGILRRDGSSNFGSNNRWGIFPSIGLSWFLSEEPFMPDLGPVNYLKLRGSWGKNGNEAIGRYQYISTITTGRNYISGGGSQIGASPTAIENADIGWEESEQLDIALDMGMFNNKLTLTLDYYIKNTKGLLEKIPIPAIVGNTPPYANVGTVQNKGIEFSLNWRENRQEFKYSIGINGAYNKNKMTYIGNEEKVLTGATWSVAGYVSRSEEGEPIGYFWGYETDGLFQTESEIYQHIGSTGEVLQPNAVPGDVRFVDVNGDGIIDEDDRTKIGSPTPDFTLGINGSFEYKNFDLSFLLTGAFGQEIFNGTQRQDLSYTNHTTEILDRWTGEGTSNETPRYTWSDVNNNYRVSDLYIEDGSYMKVKNIQLGYNIPKKLLDKIQIQAWRFYVSGENLFTFTNYSGADPEIGSITYEDPETGAKNSLNSGIDRGIYPQARTFRFGTSITF